MKLRDYERPWATRAYHAVLGLISPRRAVVAAHLDRMDRDADYREAVFLAMRAAGYRDATSQSDKTPWRSNRVSSSADAENLLQHSELRERSRESERDDAIASGLFHTYRTNVVGEGLRYNAATGDPEKDRAIDRVWSRIQNRLFPSDRLSWPEAQRLLVDGILQAGDVGVKRTAFPGANQVGFEVVEGDRVDTPVDVVGVIPEGHHVRTGVERDESDRVVAYWVSRRHPGDTQLPVTGLGGQLARLSPLGVSDFNRVPVEDMQLPKMPVRPGQSRGVPRLHAVLQDLRDLDLLVLASLKRTQVAACLAVFLETQEQITDVVSATEQKYHFQIDQDLVPGMIFKLQPGEKVSTINPDFPIPDIAAMAKIIARRVGAALGLSWQVVLSDFSEANFSSARMDRIEAEASYAIPRQAVDQVLRWVRTEALADELLLGNQELLDAGVDAEDLGMATMVPPRKPWVDPLKEALAASEALARGITTLRDVAASQGRDYREVLAQRIEEERLERELRREAGLDETPVFTVPEAAQGSTDPRPGQRAAGVSRAELIKLSEAA